MTKRNEYRIDENLLSVLEAGENGKPVAIFLHGIPASSELWKAVIEKVSEKGWFCLAPDLPGYGKTIIKNRDFYSLKGTSDLLVAWIKQQGFSDIWLIGHDIGGGIAQIMVANQENLFKKITLSNSITADSWPVPTVQKMIKASRLGIFYWLAMFGKFPFENLFASMSKAFISNQNLSEDTFRRIFYDGKFNKRKMVWKFQRMLTKLDSRYTKENMELLSSVSIPVHLVWAMSDRFQHWSKAGRTLENTFKDVKVTKIENCGHYLQLDAPDKYLDSILSDLS
ncbi:MAG: alpha/beta hydrolase [Chlorobi bacterium]|nr:alpha/beta hydrolase [Chlorobiota bacterium]